MRHNYRGASHSAIARCKTTDLGDILRKCPDTRTNATNNIGTSDFEVSRKNR